MVSLIENVKVRLVSRETVRSVRTQHWDKQISFTYNYQYPALMFTDTALHTHRLNLRLSVKETR